jgi:hypothetical protein
MSLTFEILGLASMGVILVRNFTYKFKVKPFTCELCMAFWLSVLYFHSLEGVLFSFASGMIAAILNRYV